MAYKILLAGIDGSGKSASVSLLASRLGRTYKVLRIGNGDARLISGGVETSILPPVYRRATLRVKRMVVRCRLYGLFFIFSLIYKYAGSKYLGTLKDIDVTLYETDTLLHPAVYTTYHFPWTKAVRPRLRFSLMRLLFGRKRRLTIFYLDIDPSIAMRRIIERGDDIQPHENYSDLRNLRAEFGRVLEEASRYGFEIVRINTNTKNLKEVVDEMETVLQTRFSLDTRNRMQD